MGCAEYQERINELALAAVGTKPEPKLAQHLVVCNACGEELARRQALLARIDLGVAAMVSAEAPQSVAARVRQRVAVEEGRPRSVFAAYRWFWIAGASAAIATAAILLAFALRSANRTAAPQESFANNGAPAPTSTNAANSTPAHELAKAALSGGNARATKSAGHFVASQKDQPVAVQKDDPMAAQLAAIEATPPTLEVLIPGNQPIAVRQIVFAARHDQLDEKLLAQSEAKPIDPLEVKPIKIDLIAPPDGQQSNPGPGTGSR